MKKLTWIGATEKKKKNERLLHTQSERKVIDSRMENERYVFAFSIKDNALTEFTEKKKKKKFSENSAIFAILLWKTNTA